MRNRFLLLIHSALAAIAIFASQLAASQSRVTEPQAIPRTPEGKPDFTGVWAGSRLHEHESYRCDLRQNPGRGRSTNHAACVEVSLLGLAANRANRVASFAQFAVGGSFKCESLRDPHAHLAWGLVGIYRGIQDETVYQRLD